jgi:Lon protease-like protein
MFPLGSVLFPHMPLLLRVFEDRYLIMLSRILQADSAEFGVVLIERGQEVGGGEHRFDVGTVARITQLDAPEGFVGLLAEGGRRIQVADWLDEDPHPQAAVEVLPELEWDDALQPLFDDAERVVRRALARASEFADQQWSSDVELSEEPIAASWQLAAIAPIGPLDQVALLRSPTTHALLTDLIDYVATAEETLLAAWPDDQLEPLDDAGDGADTDDDRDAEQDDPNEDVE